MKSLWPDFPVYGSMIEASECVTRPARAAQHDVDRKSRSGSANSCCGSGHITSSAVAAEIEAGRAP